MSENENVKNYFSSDDDEEEEGRYIALPAVKSRSKNGVLLKQRRQKFCAKWENTFPWLKSDNVDESIGLCTVCNKRLVCKKSHLERHERSYKHQRGSGFEELSQDDYEMDGDDPQPTEPEFLECGKQEPEDPDDFDNAIEVDVDYSLEFDLQASSKRIKQEKVQKPNLLAAIPAPRLNSKSKPSSKCLKMDRMKLLKRIDRDRNELNEYYYARQKPTSTNDSCDLFFNSVSASVKMLPPKLASEVKSRVSQIITEFELRAICEREALENSAGMEGATMVIASTTHNVAGEEIIADVSEAVPQITYTFQARVAK